MKNNESVLLRAQNIIEYCKQIRSESKKLLDSPYRNKNIEENIFSSEVELHLLLMRELIDLAKKLIVVISNTNAFLKKYNYQGINDDELNKNYKIVTGCYNSIISFRKNIDGYEKLLTEHHDFRYKYDIIGYKNPMNDSPKFELVYKELENAAQLIMDISGINLYEIQREKSKLK